MPERSPLITTVIPTYCRPHLLRRAVRSVLNQSYPNFRVRIYDNASGDETAAVVAQLAAGDPRISYHRHAANIGAIANFAYALERIDTPLFSLLSDDDVLLPSFFATALKGFEEHPEAICSGCLTLCGEGRNCAGGSGRITRLIGGHLREGIYRPPEGMLAMVDIEHPTWTGLLIRREVLQHVKFDPDVVVPCDLDFELRMAALFPICISREPGAILYVHDSCESVISGLIGSLLWWHKVIDNILTDDRIPDVARRYAARALTRRAAPTLRNYALWAVLRKHWQEARRTSESLKRFHWTGWALVLDVLRFVFRYFPPARWTALAIKSIVQFVARRAKPRTPPAREPEQDWSTYESFLQLS